MSRSFKHTPRCGDNKSNGFKTIFNRLERRRPVDEDSCAPRMRSEYKKRHSTWTICDYERVGCSFEEYWQEQMKWYKIGETRGWRNNEKPDRKECYRRWYKHYKRK